MGNDKAAGSYKTSHDASKRIGYTGSETIGMNISYCSKVLVNKFRGSKIFSKDGNAIGLNVIFGSSGVKLDKVDLYNIKAGTLVNGKWVGESYWGKSVKYVNVLPNEKPRSIGIRYEGDSIVEMDDVEIWDMYSCENPIKVLRVE